MKKNRILSSVITIALCLCLIAGSTFALFTSSDEVNIAVTAGNVQVDAYLADFATFSMDKQQETGKFANGGTAVYTDGVLTLDKVTPGDEVQFTVNINNTSDVAVQYRVRMNIEGKLGEVLVASSDLPDGTKATLNALETATVWAPLAAGVTTFPMTVELPEEVGNAYQGKTAAISIVVEAIQGNATAMTLMNDQNYDSLEAAIAAAQGGETIYVAGNVTLDTDAAYVADMKNVTIVGTDFASITAIGSGAYNATNVNLKDITVIDKSNDATLESSWKGTYLEFVGNCTFENVVFTDGVLVRNAVATFTNCSFIGHKNDSGDKYTNTVMYAVWTENSNANFEGCTFIGTRAIKVYTDAGVAATTVNVNNCAFGPLSEKPGLAITDNSGVVDVNITDSSFINTQKGGANGEYFEAYIYEADAESTMSLVDVTNCFVASDDPAKDVVVQSWGVPTLNVYFADGEDLVVNANGATLAMNSLAGANMFASMNGEKVTINDLTITGLVQSNYIGRYNTITSPDAKHYEKVAAQSNFNSELNNVNIVNCAVAKQDTAIFGAAAFTYGTATLNNCTITGTTMGEQLDGGYPVYDLGVVNHSTANINDSKLGSLYLWAQCTANLKNTDVDLIVSTVTRRTATGLNTYFYNADDGLTISGDSHIGKIEQTISSKSMEMYIVLEDNAVVDVLEITDANENLKAAVNVTLSVGANASIGSIVYNGTAYATVADFMAAIGK